MGSRLSTAALICRKPRNATPDQKWTCSGVAWLRTSSSRISANATFDNGPAADATLCMARLRNDSWCRYTAPPGRPMPPCAMKMQRQHDRQERVRVLERVQRQVAGGLDAVVAGAIGGVGVPELVQAQRDHPAADDQAGTRRNGRRSASRRNRASRRTRSTATKARKIGLIRMPRRRGAGRRSDHSSATRGYGVRCVSLPPSEGPGLRLSNDRSRFAEGGPACACWESIRA